MYRVCVLNKFLGVKKNKINYLNYFSFFFYKKRVSFQVRFERIVPLVPDVLPPTPFVNEPADDSFDIFFLFFLMCNKSRNALRKS